MPAACEILLVNLEHATARLLDLNPADLIGVEAAIAARAAAIDDVAAWNAARETAVPLDTDFAARLRQSLAAGSAVALRLTLIRLDVTAQLAGIAREKCLLEALDTRAGARAGAKPGGLDCRG